MKEIDEYSESLVDIVPIELGTGVGSLPSSSSSTKHLGGGRAIDRHNPIITDSRRISKAIPPSSPQPLPVSPELHINKTPKPNDEDKTMTMMRKKKKKKKSSKKQSDEEKRKSGAEPSDGVLTRKSWSCTKPGDFISPPPSSSSRYLLSDSVAVLDVLSDFDPVFKLVSLEPSSKTVAVKTEESPALKSSSSASRSSDQVVVLRVSLHCKGCERKMRKHISKMEGVTSFNIDFAAKKLTVVGNVTPLSVLASVSKVKNAQLWTPPMSSSFPFSEVKKHRMDA